MKFDRQSCSNYNPSRAKVSTWLFTIARSRIIDRRLDELELESALAEFPQLHATRIGKRS